MAKRGHPATKNVKNVLRPVEIRIRFFEPRSVPAVSATR